MWKSGQKKSRHPVWSECPPFDFERVDEDAKQPSLVGGSGSADLDFYTTGNTD
jgi:hypothetical protein